MPTSAPAPVVWIVDDDPQVRRLVVETLRGIGMTIEDYPSGDLFIRHARLRNPGCVLLDVRMPHLSGPEVQDWLATHHPEIPVIFLSGFADVSTAVRAMRRGAIDFLEKPFNLQVLIERVNEALRSPAGRHGNADEAPSPPPTWRSALTPRENEVLEAILSGKRIKAAASDLGISERTVETHRANILAKAGVRSVAELLALALR